MPFWTNIQTLLESFIFTIQWDTIK